MAQIFVKLAALGPAFIIGVIAFVGYFALLTALKYIKKHAEKGIAAAKAASDAIDPTNLGLPPGGLRQAVSNFAQDWKAEKSPPEEKK